VSIAQAVFLLERGHTHKVTDAIDHRMHAVSDSEDHCIWWRTTQGW